MGDKIVIGPITKGLRNDVTPFNIDNDSFPVLLNAYQWRGRIKRKRGTSLFGRLTRKPMGLFGAGVSYYLSLGNTDGAGALTVNLISLFSLEVNASITPSSLSIRIGAQTFTDDGKGNLSNGAGGLGTINYATGALTLQTAPALITTAAYILFSYYPGMPVLGLEPFVLDSSDIPHEIGFDQTYAYNMSLAYPYTIHSVSYYWNPASTTYNSIAYTQKTDWTAVNWNLANYQQIWTTNYQGAMWATPGISSPFSVTNIGMQFKPCATIAYVSATQLTITITEAAASLVVGDWVFINEVTGTNNYTVNFQTGFVTASANAAGTTTLTVRFPWAVIAAMGPYSNGILQYLTASSNSAKDCLRWYNGDPVSSATPPVFATSGGWVNFSPPLLSGPNSPLIIEDLPSAQYYLIGARMIVPFKDRLLFFGPVLQTSTGVPIYLQDTVIYSQNGTPYYTCSFDGTATNATISPTTAFTAFVVPSNQSSSPASYFEDVNGFGGFISAGYARPITSVSPNEDALIIGFADRQARLLYTGNDIVPFNFYIINSELGSDATFSSITLDRGVLSIGGRGIILTSQISSQRVDLEIPDEIFRISLLNSGARRICAQRDFISEWIYFTIPSDNSITIYPSRTLQYNYREDTWAIFHESYTTYGTIRKSDGDTWATLTDVTWDTWTTPWNSGISEALEPTVIGGNQQGFILERASSSEGATDEATSLYIQSIIANVVTSPSHGLDGDYIVVTGCLGTIGSLVNGKIFSATRIDENTFYLDPAIGTGTYLGGGLITRLYVPEIQTRQFPVAWDMARKTRLGPQQYLLSRTPRSQITLYIYLSQDNSNPYNYGPIVPNDHVENSSLIYSTILYTCPEGTNLGLTPANINLQMVTASTQSQIWHRVNTSLIGDTVQLGFTISDAQMRAYYESGTAVDITGVTQASPCVLTCSSNFPVGALIKIEDVEGMTELNFVEDDYNYYEVLAVDATTVTINVDSTGFGAYTTGGTAVEVALQNAQQEVEIHSIILDVQPSMVLA